MNCDALTISQVSGVIMEMPHSDVRYLAKALYDPRKIPRRRTVKRRFLQQSL